MEETVLFGVIMLMGLVGYVAGFVTCRLCPETVVIKHRCDSNDDTSRPVKQDKN